MGCLGMTTVGNIQIWDGGLGNVDGLYNDLPKIKLPKGDNFDGLHNEDKYSKWPETHPKPLLT